MQSKLVEIRRLDANSPYTEIKDPSVVQTPDGVYMMYASLGRSDIQQWVIGRFTAMHPGGPWQEIEPADIAGVDGPQVCAPAVVLEQDEKGDPLFKMYVQTACFRDDGVIALATSRDGRHFEGEAAPVLAKEDVPPQKHPVSGLYDVAVSDIVMDEVHYECMVFSGYRKVGCGDLYMSLREKTQDGSGAWGTPFLALSQEDVPFHNRPGHPDFEWGLEGAKLVQLDKDIFMMIGVCFLDKGRDCIGTRQRVFLAAAQSPMGPYRPVSMPLEPTLYDAGQGENGHPDTVDLGERIGILYQERAGDFKPWHLRYAEVEKSVLLELMRAKFAPAKSYGPGPALKA